MAQIAVNPIVLKNVAFVVGDPLAGDDYRAHVSSVTFTPSAETQTWQGLTPEAAFTAQSASTWVCALAYAQDWSDPLSLSYYLHEHEGEQVPVTFEPEDGGASVAATLVIAPGAIGGAVNAFMTAEVSLGVSGKPVITPPAA